MELYTFYSYLCLFDKTYSIITIYFYSSVHSLFDSEFILLSLFMLLWDLEDSQYPKIEPDA